MDNFKVIKLRTGESILCQMDPELPFSHHKDDITIQWPVQAIPIQEFERDDDGKRIGVERLATKAWMPYSCGHEFKVARDMIVSIGVMRPTARYQYEGFVERWKIQMEAELIRDAIVTLMESVNPGKTPMIVRDEDVYDVEQESAELPNTGPTEQLYHGNEGNGTH